MCVASEMRDWSHLRPLVVLLALPRSTELHVLVIGPTPEERLEAGLRAQKPCLSVGVAERVDLLIRRKRFGKGDRGTNFCESVGLGERKRSASCASWVCVCVGAGRRLRAPARCRAGWRSRRSSS